MGAGASVKIRPAQSQGHDAMVGGPRGSSFGAGWRAPAHKGDGTPRKLSNLPGKESGGGILNFFAQSAQSPDINVNGFGGGYRL